jgi:hypothetical protein
MHHDSLHLPFFTPPVHPTALESLIHTTMPHFHNQKVEKASDRVFSVITRFEPGRMHQIFIQNGRTIQVPAPNWEGIPADTNTINADFCSAAPVVFGDRDRFAEVGGYEQLDRALQLPMVLVMSIWSDVSLSHSGDLNRLSTTREELLSKDSVLTSHNSIMQICSGLIPFIRPKKRVSRARQEESVRKIPVFLPMLFRNKLPARLSGLTSNSDRLVQLTPSRYEVIMIIGT